MSNPLNTAGEIPYPSQLYQYGTFGTTPRQARPGVLTDNVPHGASRSLSLAASVALPVHPRPRIACTFAGRMPSGSGRLQEVSTFGVGKVVSRLGAVSASFGRRTTAEAPTRRAPRGRPSPRRPEWRPRSIGRCSRYPSPEPIHHTDWTSPGCPRPAVREVIGRASGVGGTPPIKSMRSVSVLA